MSNQSQPKGDIVPITVMIKDGGYETVIIPIDLLGKLAFSIRANGAEWLSLTSKAIQVVGFIATGIQTGERVIVIGKESVS